MRKAVSLFIIICMMITSITGCAPAAQEASAPIEADANLPVPSTSAAPVEQQETKSRLVERTLPLYYLDKDGKDEASFYYVDGQMDIPYIDTDTAIEILTNFNTNIKEDSAYTLSSKTEDGVVTLTRDNGSEAMLDFNESTIAFSDYNDFLRSTYTTTGLDILSFSDAGGDGKSAYINRSEYSFERKGRPILVELFNHDIFMVYEDDKGYLPLQTFSDLFLSPSDITILYNGEMAAAVTEFEENDLTEIYYSVPTGKRSKALAEFNYNELCLALEMFYGLKVAHNIESFDILFTQTGLRDRLLSEDSVEADQALFELCMGYFADMHSAFLKPSAYAGKDADTVAGNISASVYDMIISMQRYSTARNERYPNGTRPYEEIGNTAYVTFDSFNTPSERDYYETPATADDTDTIGIIMYAHSRIMRKNSPIKNVVIDLSNNGGGEVDAAVFVIGWFLGTCAVNIDDNVTKAQASTRYKIDANADRVFDEKDTLASKNLYCIISPCSFSCGNLVPAAFKSSGVVTLLGETSGGGACAVQRLSTADGSLMQISGRLRLSYLSNGSYYDVDQGVTPDIPITKLDHFYDRRNLTSYINKLY